MAQPAPAPGAKGPIGQPMNPMTVALLTLITCGIYGYYWLYKTGEELKNHNGDGLGGVAAALLGLVYVGWFMVPMEVEKTYQSDGKQSPVNAMTTLWLLIPLVGLFFYFPKIQGALNDYWVSKGAQPVA